MRMRHAAFCPAPSVFAFLFSALTAAACPAPGAIYAPALEDPLAEAVTITLSQPAPDDRMANSGLDLRLALPNRAPFAFGTAQKLGYGSSVAFPRPGNPIHDSETRPEFLFAAFALGPEGRLIPTPSGVVLEGEDAPTVIQIAGAGAALWYGTNGSDRPVILPEALWYLVSCGP